MALLELQSGCLLRLRVQAAGQVRRMTKNEVEDHPGEVCSPVIRPVVDQGIAGISGSGRIVQGG